MATEIAVDSDRESQAEVDAVLAEAGLTMDQVRRWRREGLLPDVLQDQQAYRGSVVLYPKGTCAQIRAASALFKQKNRVDYVGVRLWRLGFPVDEKHWRPRLRKAGRQLDWIVPLVMKLMDRFDRDSESETIHDRAAPEFAKTDDVVLSRLKRRTNVDNLPILLRILSEVGAGDFHGFDDPSYRDEDGKVWRSVDETTVIGAFDLINANSHSVLEKRLNLIRLLPSGLGHVSTAMRMGNFVHAADAPAEEIARARGDANNALAIGLNLYEAARWVYGDGAFGLRLAAWIARKAPDALLDSMTLLMFRLRQVRAPFCPQTRSPRWRGKLAKSVSIQKGMSGTGATIPASRKFFTRNELNWPWPTKLH